MFSHELRGKGVLNLVVRIGGFQAEALSSKLVYVWVILEFLIVMRLL